MEHAASPHFNFSAFIFALANFILFAGGIFFLMRKKISSFFSQRASTIRKQIEEATRLKEETFQKFEALDARIANIDLEIKAIADSLAKEGQLERDRLIHEGQRLAQKIIEDLALSAESERRKLEQRIKDMIFGRSEELLKAFFNAEENRVVRRQVGENLIATLIKKGDLH